MNEELTAAYAFCRSIARREAKNFYYSFLALPAPRKNAICAIYAFMRKADDLADDERFSIAERRKQLAEWLAEWHFARKGAPTADPVFLAVRDTCEHFVIPFALLDELVSGTTMDLDRQSSREEPDTYATFQELYRYCYLVASVVGLVVIRIFGYTDPRAEKLAERTGIAFQLTNILRDVREDAARNRLYLPLDMLADHGLAVESVLTRKSAGRPNAAEKKLLQEVAAKAEEYYRAASELLPLIDRESRPALWVLVSIYHQLLRRIGKADYDVFSRRASVPTWQKLAILSSGILRMLWVRLLS